MKPVRIDAARRRLLQLAPWAASTPLWITAALPRAARADPSLRRVSRPLMGTQLDLCAHGPDAAMLDQAVEAAYLEMGRLSNLMSRYRPDSRVNALRLSAGLQPVRVEPEMLAVLQMAQTLSRHSGGAFDVTVGAFAGWDFDPVHPAIPAAHQLASERLLVDHRDLQIDAAASTAYLRRRGMRIDLGGIAKLPILQAGMSVLRQHGVAGAMINGGGDVLVHGRLQGRRWRIGLRDPRAPQSLLGLIELDEGFVAASGDYERCFVRAGRRYHHVLDPRSGEPTHGPRGVVLVSTRLSDINGLGTAIMVAGERAGRQWLAQRQGVDALIVRPDAPPWLNAGMQARLRAGPAPDDPA